MAHIGDILRRFWQQEDGITAIEFSLIVAGIALAFTATSMAFTSKNDSVIESVNIALRTIGG